MKCIVCKRDLKDIDYYVSKGKIDGKGKVSVKLCEECFKERKRGFTISFNSYFSEYFIS